LGFRVNGAAEQHIPVLGQELAEQINLPRDGIMVDATIGQGGHSLLFGGVLGSEGLLIGLDVDEKAIALARSRLAGLACKVIVVYANFSHIAEELYKLGLEKVDFILADLGICSGQLDDEEKGLSFQRDMPLDMRIDKKLRTSAADIVNKADEKGLADLIYRFGEERASRRIARFIVQQRQRVPIRTTGQLSGIICRALRRPGRAPRPRIHPATRTFQALRIAVNHEMENLEGFLRSAREVLAGGGRLAVISFHSLEDRLVKNDFKRNKAAGLYRIVTKKPIVPSVQEIMQNRRARSAKLRIAERT